MEFANKIRYSEIGETICERNALFNNCIAATIFRDSGCNGQTIWSLLIDTRPMEGGFMEGNFKTRKAAIAFTLARYPNFEIWAKYGKAFSHIQDMSDKLKAELIRVNGESI